MQPGESQASSLKVFNLSDLQCQEMFDFLVVCSDRGKLQYGSISKVANYFKCTTRTISQIWHRRKYSSVNGMIAADVSARI